MTIYQKFLNIFDKSVDRKIKNYKIRFTCSARARGSLTNSLDNLCGHSAGIIGRLKKRSLDKGNCRVNNKTVKFIIEQKKQTFELKSLIMAQIERWRQA